MTYDLSGSVKGFIKAFKRETGVELDEKDEEILKELLNEFKDVWRGELY